MEHSPNRDLFSGYLSDDTIAAPATAVGGALAIVRVSGKRAGAIVSELCAGISSDLKEAHGRARWTPIGRNQLIDEGVVTCFAGPASFTGEDVVEFSVHGGPATVETLVASILALGARQARPGEFSFRAFRNGKLSLRQVQALPDLIAARSEPARIEALDRLTERAPDRLALITDRLIDVVAQLELGIDFSDPTQADVPELELASLKPTLKTLCDELSDLESGYRRARRIRQGVALATVGLPNAGKSSLFNRLLASDRAIVSDVPGTTRDALREDLRFRIEGGSEVHFVLHDTAGIRKTDDRVEAQGVLRSKAALREAEIVLWVLDPQTPRSQWLEFFEEIGGPRDRVVGVLSKADLAGRFSSAGLSNGADLASTLEKETGLGEWLEVSAVTGAGVDRLLRALVRRYQALANRQPGEFLLSGESERDACVEAAAALRRSIDADDISIAAAEIKQAASLLMSVALPSKADTGSSFADQVLGRIFSRFCIGK